MFRRLLVAFFLFAALAGCGGGGGGSGLPPTQPTATPSAGPQTVTISIIVPAASGAGSALTRKPRYVSVKTQSVSVSVNGGTPVVASVATGSPNCAAATAAGRTCTVSLSAPLGADTFTVVTYASTNGTGAPLSQNSTTATIVAGKANTVSLTLEGVVASIALTLSNPTPTQGAAATIALAVNVTDGSGATIVGSEPFANPIALTDSDTSGATVLSKTTLNSPADAAGLTVTYNGAAVPRANFSASASGVPAASITSATLTPQVAQATSFVDWPTYGYDVQRSGFNPYTTAITPASISGLHLAWQATLGASTQTQPIVVTNVAGHQALLIVGDFTIAQAYDALTGQLVWQQTLPAEDVQDCGTGGISGTAAYDKALGAIFMAAGSGSTPNHTLLFRLDAATGNITGQVDVTPTLLPGEADRAHSGITLANGRIYLGTGSDCEGTPSGLYPSWRGRVVSVDPSSMTLLSTFFTTWQVGSQPGNFGGGGVWAWGGVSADPSGNIYVATGNAETNNATAPQTAAAPFAAQTDETAGDADSLLKLSGDLSTVLGVDSPKLPVGAYDMDYAGTPVIYTPPATSGCGQVSVTQGKNGQVVVNNTQSLAELGTFNLSVPNPTAYYIGNPAYSPNTGYVYAAISSSGAGSSMLPPGLAAIGGCGSSIVWHAQFGPDSTLYNTPNPNPRSAPTVTAGGVVFMGTPCTSNGNGGCGSPSTVNGALWAVDAATGNLLGGGNPLLVTGDNIRMAPSADGLWIYVLDDSGNFYGLTIDPTVKAIAARAGRRVARPFRIRAHA